MTLGSHQTSIGKSQTHCTPRWIITRLGPFDLDPCAAHPRPWDCATANYIETDDGLRRRWHGRVSGHRIASCPYRGGMVHAALGGGELDPLHGRPDQVLQSGRNRTAPQLRRPAHPGNVRRRRLREAQAERTTGLAGDAMELAASPERRPISLRGERR